MNVSPKGNLAFGESPPLRFGVARGRSPRTIGTMMARENDRDEEWNLKKRGPLMRVGTENGRGMSEGQVIPRTAWSSIKTQRSQHGFSLVELVVALIFAAILSLIAMPNVGNFFAKYQLMGASNQLGFDIARARMQAVGQNRFARIKMQSATQYARETSTDSTRWSRRCW